MYVKVPAIEGVPQVGTMRLISGTSISETEAVAYVDGTLQEGWIELTEAEYLAAGGVIPVPTSAQPSAEERIAQLEQVVDTLLTGGGVTP